MFVYIHKTDESIIFKNPTQHTSFTVFYLEEELQVVLGCGFVVDDGEMFVLDREVYSNMIPLQ